MQRAKHTFVRDTVYGLSRRDLLRGLVFTAAVGLPRFTWANSVTQLELDDLYAPGDVARLKFTSRIRALAGEIVSVEGYRLPHNRSGARFICVSSEPGKTCPHCAAMATMPRGMIAYYPPTGQTEVAAPNDRVVISGVLELGAKRDFDTGFVTTIRIRAPSLLVS